MTTSKPRFRDALILAGAASLVFARDAHAQAVQPGIESACFPSCRSGFVCSKGQCVSRCNPACAANEMCTPSGECVAPQAQGGPTAVPAPTLATGRAATDAALVHHDSTTSSGVHFHDGFYLRMGIGLGGASFAGEVTSRDRIVDGAGVESRAVAVPLELAIGGTPLPGLVVGLGSYASLWPLPHDKLKNYGQSLEADGGSITVASSGPFVDCYFRPEQGLHAQLAIAFATATAAKSADRSAVYPIPARDLSGSGWSIMTGLGWETWIGDQWSAGILGRIQYGQVSLRSSDGYDKMATTFAVVGAMASFTYH